MYLGTRDYILHGRARAKSKRAFPIRQSSTSRPRAASDQSSFKRASRPRGRAQKDGWIYIYYGKLIYFLSLRLSLLHLDLDDPNPSEVQTQLTFRFFFLYCWVTFVPPSERRATKTDQSERGFIPSRRQALAWIRIGVRFLLSLLLLFLFPAVAVWVPVLSFPSSAFSSLVSVEVGVGVPVPVSSLSLPGQLGNMASEFESQRAEINSCEPKVKAF